MARKAGKNPQRPSDPNQRARLIVDIVRGESDEPKAPRRKTLQLFSWDARAASRAGRLGRRACPPKSDPRLRGRPLKPVPLSTMFLQERRSHRVRDHVGDLESRDVCNLAFYL